ncbi:hypothetical protein ISN36_00405 [Xanthomonas translucens pv. undulosa]|nr:hypothetical protein F0H32_02365 [Xanthomonas translucens pv. undulosa]QSQ54425.1 hypothetical protein ISN36_00405 [Xanthomonas translucens pv. undulosa]QSQ61999.1 hypothetical protein ISN38_07840 [Xanthomonas translucens pv. undulosa]
MRAEEDFNIEQLAENFGISRSNVYRALQ